MLNAGTVGVRAKALDGRETRMSQRLFLGDEL
jgi:hypothetical protein